MQLTCHHIRSDKYGYGQLGLNIARALRDLGVDVINPEITVSEFDEGMVPKTNVALWVTVPPHIRGSWKGQHVACFTMWESGRLPESFIGTMDQLDTVIVPNHFNQEQFSEFHPNVRKVNLGVDTDVFTPKRRVKDGMWFDFLICGQGIRKGTDIAYDAFLKAFPDWKDLDPMPRLVCKNTKEDFVGENVMRIGNRLPLPDLVALYHHSHVYVQPARGEGWGYFPHQALATGMPTILSDIPGHRDYAEGTDGAILIPTSREKSAYFVYGDAGEWWVPDAGTVADAMRATYENYPRHVDAAMRGSERIAAKFSSEVMGRRLIEVLTPEALSAPYFGSGEWVQTPQRRFPTVLLKPWRAEIAGLTYIWEANKTYYELADVKRILYEANLLDPTCLDESVIGREGDMFVAGLTEDQVARMGAYSAANSKCPTCRQPLNPAGRISNADWEAAHPGG